MNQIGCKGREDSVRSNWRGRARSRHFQRIRSILDHCVYMGDVLGVVLDFGKEEADVWRYQWRLLVCSLCMFNRMVSYGGDLIGRRNKVLRTDREKRLIGIPGEVRATTRRDLTRRDSSAPR